MFRAMYSLCPSVVAKRFPKYYTTMRGGHHGRMFWVQGGFGTRPRYSVLCLWRCRGGGGGGGGGGGYTDRARLPAPPRGGGVEPPFRTGSLCRETEISKQTPHPLWGAHDVTDPDAARHGTAGP